MGAAHLDPSQHSSGMCAGPFWFDALAHVKCITCPDLVNKFSTSRLLKSSLPSSMNAYLSWHC